jgi:putative hydrolase of the HAD superfamily
MTTSLPLAWDKIDSVLLDMDGTLLDLHFDNHFWLDHVPRRYAEKHGMDMEQARREVMSVSRSTQGTLDWYCLDYWSGKLGLDVALLKQEVEHLIAVHPDVIDFLDWLRGENKRLALVTNAHGKSLELKMRRTRLGRYFDQVVCSHDLGLPKEHTDFWKHLRKQLSFDPRHTLLVDDSLPVLRSARDYGIRHLLAVLQPDSKQPPRQAEEFHPIRSFLEIMPRA